MRWRLVIFRPIEKWAHAQRIESVRLQKP